MTDSWHIRATLLPHGDTPVDLWVQAGFVRFRPVDGAAKLPGAFLLPGLTDCHTHLTLGGTSPGSAETVDANLVAHLRAGELALRDAGGVGLAALKAQGRVGRPRLQSAAGFLAPEGRYLPVGEWCSGSDLVAAVYRHAAAGARWIKVIADWPSRDGIRANYSIEELRAAVEAAHDLGLRVLTHIVGPEGSRLAIAAGVDSLEHGDGLTEEDLRALAARAGAWTPTIAMYPSMIRASVSRPESAERLVAARDERMRWMIPAAARAGLTILAGTDSLPKGSIWREVAALVEYGLEPASALGAASTDARAFLGLPGVGEGAPADLVLYDADPRNDPEVLRTPGTIMLEGELIHP